MNTIAEPTLAPPGAGLPHVELVIARLLFAFRRATGNRESFTADFQREHETIRQLIHRLGAKAAAERVLIPRLRGIEDSSRYWSVWMTLDHLRIVNNSITHTIDKLAKDIVPPGQASTATVKPSPNVTGEVVAAYETSCDELLALVARIPDLGTRARYAHPWFGPLEAADWHAMAGTHLAIHRKQIQEIIKRLAA